MAEHAGEKETALPHQRGEQEHPAPSKSYSGAKPRRLMRLLGEFAPICPQRFLTLPCHGFLAVTRAVLLGGFLACTSLAPVLSCIRPCIPWPPTPRWPCSLAELLGQLDCPQQTCVLLTFATIHKLFATWKASSAASLASVQSLLSALAAQNFSTQLHCLCGTEGKHLVMNFGYDTAELCQQNCKLHDCLFHQLLME